MGTYFGTNGIRGIPGRGFFTLDFACIAAAAIGAHLLASARGGEGGGTTVLVGYDGRSTGPLICSAVSAALSYAGIDCAVAGMLSTPCLEYEVRKKPQYAGGIMITASHNPPEYNGLKAVASDGIEVSRQDELRIEDMITSGGVRAAGNERWGAISSAREFDYVSDVASRVDKQAISARGLRVVIDSGNGAQGPFAAELCGMLGCRYTVINQDVDGRFPGRGPEPTPENLSQLSREVVRSGADLGVAFDGDGDRSIFCDEAGGVVIGDRSALILARHILGGSRGSSIATCLNSSSSAEKVAAEFGSDVIRTRIGSVEVSQCMRETGALIGYEENGGFMYGAHNAVRDGCMTLALMLDALASSEITLSQHAGRLPPSYTAKTKVRCAENVGGGGRSAGSTARSVMERLRDELDVSDDSDGLKVLLSDAGDRWVLVRPSGTEPALRVYAEAPTQGEADGIVAEYAKMLLGMDGVSPY